MKTKKIILSWLGHTDIISMAESLSRSDKERLAGIIGDKFLSGDGWGPVKTLLQQIAFDEVHLLSNYPDWINKKYSAWLECKSVIHSVNLANPTDYSEIFHIVDHEIKNILQGQPGKSIDLSILLSPGTPAMAAIWVLLGKSKYPAKFYQTYKNKAWETVIPFDLTVDFIPDILRNIDSAFHHLTSFRPRDIQGFEHIDGDSKAIRLAVGRARQAALRDVSVLILGESGTGKELFARAIHNASSRKNGPFVAVNCGAIPRDLFESELFGHVKGSFTGAHENRQGVFSLADKGILFLDEISECDPAMQIKLLRVLQPPFGSGVCSREFKPVGAVKSQTVDVRIIAATNRNLLKAVASGDFREDLYYRIASVVIKLPSLRERQSDIPELASVLLEQINRDFEKLDSDYRHKIISDSTIKFVQKYHWPGNVRELGNVLLQAAVMAEGDELTTMDIEAGISELPCIDGTYPLNIAPIDENFCLEEHIRDIQINYLKKAMQEAGGIKTKAAQLLGFRNYQTFAAQLKSLKIK
ncbi:MAG: sigma 54-interacting transcriptional regulator [Desulfobulbaceae bacterium]|nr:sigma 54-interacting transcriptional regulator [Desulfobulbaceae bacterium]